ncbi:MAG: amidohydrolase, partial [Betaproteobacteria bacterium]|nr:amidohydrolase [Betaproteobacteria bacterium]
KPHAVSHDMMLADMDAAGVDCAIIVPPSWEGDRNDLALEAARLYPHRFAVMGRLPLERPDSRALLAGWRRQKGMLGLRFTFHTDTQRRWLHDGTADWIWPAAERCGLPLMVFAPGSLPSLRRIAMQHPGLRLIVDHAGLDVELRGDDAFREIDDVCALSPLPNVAIKMSGMPAYSVEAYPFRDLHGWIRQYFDAFGPQRLLWGTDITRMTCSYRECVTLFTEALPWIATADLAWIMGDSACHWTGWSVPRESRAG